MASRRAPTDALPGAGDAGDPFPRTSSRRESPEVASLPPEAQGQAPTRRTYVTAFLCQLYVFVMLHVSCMLHANQELVCYCTKRMVYALRLRTGLHTLRVHTGLHTIVRSVWWTGGYELDYIHVPRTLATARCRFQVPRHIHCKQP